MKNISKTEVCCVSGGFSKTDIILYTAAGASLLLTMFHGVSAKNLVSSVKNLIVNRNLPQTTRKAPLFLFYINLFI